RATVIRAMLILRSRVKRMIQGAGKTILINYIVTSTCKLAPSKTLELKISVPTRLPTPECVSVATRHSRRHSGFTHFYRGRRH
ncbi:hypothetical protein, partial [Salinispora arenicola]|uniref:hypothetical protein n=1 Tax=Salinispora arenicola TaxID=168697 RepID=UPI0027DC6D75